MRRKREKETEKESESEEEYLVELEVVVRVPAGIEEGDTKGPETSDLIERRGERGGGGEGTVR